MSDETGKAGTKSEQESQGWTAFAGAQRIRDWLFVLAPTVSMIGVLALLVIELRDETVLVEPVSVHATLSNDDVKGERLAARLAAAVSEIRDKADSEKAKRGIASRLETIDLAIPSSNMSLGSVVGLLRRYLGYKQTRISSELSSTPAGLIIDLWANTEPSRYARVVDTSSDMSTLVDQAAVHIMRWVDPYTLAAYDYDHSGPTEALQSIKYCVEHCAQSDRPWIYNLWGNYLVQLDPLNLDQSVSHYRRAVALDRSFDVAYTSWGDALAASGLCGQAIEKYRMALSLRPDDGYTLVARADCLEILGRDAEAEREYRQAERVIPNLALRHYAAFLRSRGRYEEADDTYRSWAEIEPLQYEVYVDWALNESLNREYERAIELLKNAAELEPNRPEAYVQWGDILLAMNAGDYAGHFYALALTLDAESSRAYRGLGSLASMQSQWPTAVENFKRALELAPRDEGTLLAWGDALRRRRSFDDAAHFYRAAQSRNPNEVVIRQRIQSVRSRTRSAEGQVGLPQGDTESAVPVSVNDKPL